MIESEHKLISNRYKCSRELAPYDRNDQNDQHRDDRYRYNPIRSHSRVSC